MPNVCRVPDAVKNLAPGPPAHNASLGLFESNRPDLDACWIRCLNCFEGINLHYGIQVRPDKMTSPPDP